ncbi:NAD(P)/FAD-dependent oxidoreductase [Candidatus Bathyarchaeota archaeon]|nr:NAD(P)/FAD-dependent oxidoreductase [Candidatus Bathyarchaeota archaeon]
MIKRPYAKEVKQQIGNVLQPDENNTYDVIIIGGGPAGSTSGYLLSKAGLKVIIVDKSQFPREKLCAGLLTQKTVNLITSLFHETISSLRKKDIINFESSYYEVFFRNRCIAKINHEATPFYYVDRTVYDNFFLQKAKAAGAEILEGEIAVSTDYSKNEIVTSDGKTLSSKYIIGADGVYSRVRRELFFERQRSDSWQRGLASAYELFIDKKTIRNAPDSYSRIFYGVVNWGYAWMFPNRDRIILGVGGLPIKNGKNLLSSFHKFLSSLGLSNSEMRVRKGHAVPYGNFLKNPVRKSTFLVGDAAGFADPLLGEGIFYAHKSAQLASLAIIQEIREGKNAGDTYRRKLRKQIYPQLIGAKKLRQLLFSEPNSRSHYIGVQVLLRLVPKIIVKMIHDQESYSRFGHLLFNLEGT